jgi:hypothetical protein
MHLEMMIATVLTSFPVLGLSRGHLVAFREPDSLTTCGEAGLRTGFFDDLVLIDADGYKYKVDHVKKLGPAGPFRGFRLLRSRKVKIALELSVPEKLTLAQTKQLISGVLSESQGIDVAEMKARIERAESFSEITGLF